jgi:hypothetical protein
LKQTNKRDLYSQGAEWKKIGITLNREQGDFYVIQGRNMEELNFAAKERLGLASEGNFLNLFCNSTF